MRFIVTGASSGIGFAVAKSLATRNNDVIAVARSADGLRALKRCCEDRIEILSADLATESGLFLVVERAHSVGRVDGIVHAAGSLVNPMGYQNLKADKMLADMNIHVAVPVSLNNALEDVLAGGRILFIDSYSAINLRVGWSGYSIVKAAAQMAARAAVEEINRSAVIRVFPGAVRTPLVDAVLSAKQRSPTFDLFTELESNGAISDPDGVGEFIADVLVSASDEQLEEREFWDIGNPDDRIF